VNEQDSMVRDGKGPKPHLSFGPLGFSVDVTSPLPYFPASPLIHDGSLATCMTSVPGGISGDTTLIRSPVAVRSRT
jgi:hypothetical protein